MIIIPDYWLTFLISAGLPMVIAIITKRYAQAWFRGMLLAALSAVTGVLTSVQAAGGYLEWKAALAGFFLSFMTAAGINYGLLEPTGVTGDTGKISARLPGGIGPVSRTAARMPAHPGELTAWHDSAHVTSGSGSR